MLTSDPIYNKPYKPQITIKDTGNTTTFYDYNPWTDSGDVNKPTHLSLNLSENTHGKFVCQIEDGGRTLDRSSINKGARLFVKVGKQASQMTTVMSGLIREVADARGSNRKDLYTLGGSSTSIRNNERVIYYIKQAAKLAQDGITIDVTDPNMKAVKLLVQAYAGVNSINPNTGSEGGLGILNITNTQTNSQVNNFIADLAIEFGEIQDAVNFIEEQTGSELIVSNADVVNLRYDITNLVGGRGFTIKNQTYRISGQDDDADDTMYLVRKNWKYGDSVYKADSYANRISAIYPAEPEPHDKLELGFGYNDLPGHFAAINYQIEFAQKFRPTHSHFYPGDIYTVGMQEGTAGGNNWAQWFRICNDSGGLPQNTNGIVANLLFGKEQWPDIVTAIDERNAESYILTNNYIMYNPGATTIIHELNLDTNKDYWLIGANQGIPTNDYFHWGQDTTPDALSANGAKVHSSTFSTSFNGGGSWTTAGGKPCFAIPRKRSQAIVMTDPKAIKNLGSGLATGGTPIESHIPSFPSLIKTKISGYSYAVNQLYYMAKPRANYSIPAVTAPNIPPLPGDPIVISDSVLNFSTPGNKVIFTRCGDYNMSWGNLDGSGLTYTAPTLLNINPVGSVPRYK